MLAFVDKKLEPKDRMDIDEFTDWLTARILDTDKSSRKPCPTSSHFKVDDLVQVVGGSRRGINVFASSDGSSSFATIIKPLGVKPRCHYYRVRKSTDGEYKEMWVVPQLLTQAKIGGRRKKTVTSSAQDVTDIVVAEEASLLEKHTPRPLRYWAKAASAPDVFRQTTAESVLVKKQNLSSLPCQKRVVLDINHEGEPVARSFKQLVDDSNESSLILLGAPPLAK